MNATRVRRTAAALLGVLFAACAAAAEESPAPPKFYAFCVDLPAVKNPDVAAQARLLAELGFDGAGYNLWLGDELDKNLAALDAAGIQPMLLYTSVNIDPKKPAYDPRLPEALKKLKGRPATICVLLGGFPPGDPRGEQPAMEILRRLGDLAAENGLRISIYHHVNNWTESLPFALEIVEKLGHPNVGVNFNLCHWLKVEGKRDYRPLLTEHGKKIFAVTINGAQTDSQAWTDGLIQPLDRGDFDNRALLAALRQAGYQGPIGLMCYAVPGDARQHLARSIRVWKQWQTQDSPK